MSGFGGSSDFEYSLNQNSFHTTEELIEEIQNGRMIILVDDEDRENEGDLVLAADYVTPQKINFMMKEARGLICLAMSSEQISRLQLPLMTRSGQSLAAGKAAFTVSIDAATGISTGVSAQDRAHTIYLATRATTLPHELVVPGHTFPLCAQEGGVLARPGHTEGSVDLARLAHLSPAAIICEVINEDGSMARGDELFAFSRRHGIKIGKINDLIKYRLRQKQ